MELGKEVFHQRSSQGNKKEQLVRHHLTRKIKRVSEEKVNRMLGVSSSHHRQHAQEQKPPTMLREVSLRPRNVKCIFVSHS